MIRKLSDTPFHNTGIRGVEDDELVGMHGDTDPGPCYQIADRTEFIGKISLPS
jgi:hypothetical protein